MTSTASAGRVATGISPGGGGIPEQIVATLKQVIRRSRLAVVVRGGAALLASLLASLLVLMGVDRLWVLPSGARWLLAFVAMGEVVFAVAWFLLRPLAQTFSLRGVARLIEQKHPELQERLSSTVELAGSRESAEFRGSEALIAAMVGEAVVKVRGVQAKREISFRPARPFLIAAGAVVAVLAGLSAAWPQATWDHLRRSLLPSLNVGVWEDQIVVRVLTGDTVHASADGKYDFAMLRGEQFRVEVGIPSRFADEAHFNRVSGSRESADDMLSVSGSQVPRFQYATGAVYDDEFTFCIRAGDALTRNYRVRVVPRPVIESVATQVESPAYVGRAEPPAPLIPGATIKAVVGSKIAAIVRPVAGSQSPSVRANVDGAMISFAGDQAGAFRSAQMEMKEPADHLWSVRVEDAYGFASMSTEFTVAAAGDEAPGVSVTIPDREKLVMPDEATLRLPPRSSLPIQYVITDDYGVSSAWVAMTADGKDVPQQKIDVVDGQAAGRWLIDMSKPELSSAGKITFQVMGMDRLPGRVEPGKSLTFTIMVDQQAKSYYEQVAAADEEFIRKALLSILERLKAAKDNSGQVQKQIRGVRGGAASLSAQLIEKVTLERKNLSDARSETVALGVAITEQGVYIRIAEQLTVLADQHIIAADNLAQQILLTDDYDGRVDQAGRSGAKVQDAIDLVKSMLADLHKQVEAVKQARMLADLARQEAQLAEAAPDAKSTESAPMSDKDWREWQKDVSDQVGEIANRDPRAEAEKMDAARKKAGELVKEAAELRKRQDELRQAITKLGVLNWQIEQAGNRSSDANQARKAERDAILASNGERAKVQEKLAGEVEEFSEKAEQLSRDVPELGMQSSNESVQEASQSAKEASRSADNAAGQMKAGDPNSRAVSHEQDEAAQWLGKAEHALSGLESSLEIARDSLVGETPVVDQKKLNEAHDATENAEKTAKSQDAREAASRLEQLAHQAAEKASEMGLNVDVDGLSDESKQEIEDGKGTGMRRVDRSAVKLQSKSAGDDLWARFHGKLHDDVLQARTQLGPREYRDMIRRYFEILAKEGRSN